MIIPSNLSDLAGIVAATKLVVEGNQQKKSDE